MSQSEPSVTIESGHSSDHQGGRRRVMALTLAAFCIGTSEFILVGILPMLAHEFSIGIPAVGMLVTGYALSVTLGSPVLALLMGRFDRKHSLIFLMTLFALGNLLCALSRGFAALLVARIFTALCHGAFFGIGSIVAADLGPREQRAQSVALMFTGLALANIVGVPMGTAVGHRLGWRITFAIIAILALMAAVLIWWMIPVHPSRPKPLRDELSVVLRLPVVLTLLLSTLCSVSLFSVLTYLVPILEHTTHLARDPVTGALLCFGGGVTAGNLIGSRFTDHQQKFLLLGGLVTTALVLFAMPSALTIPVSAMAVLFVWGMMHFASGTPLQPRIIKQAHGTNFAATLNQSAFNLGNAIGASVGGVLLTRGLAYDKLPTFAGSVMLFTATVACCTLWFERPRQLVKIGTAHVMKGVF
jgi:DHA1 family inner membrane transport protein